jgi:hypothetical protein
MEERQNGGKKRMDEADESFAAARCKRLTIWYEVTSNLTDTNDLLVQFTDHIILCRPIRRRWKMPSVRFKVYHRSIDGDPPRIVPSWQRMIRCMSVSRRGTSRPSCFQIMLD